MFEALSALKAAGSTLIYTTHYMEEAERLCDRMRHPDRHLGGAWFPLQQFPLPGFVEVAMKSTLTHWAVSGYQGIFWSHLSWMDPAMLRKTAVLLGFTLAAGLAARALFRARYLGRR